MENIFINNAPARFLISLANRKGSVLDIGREYYNTPKSIYDNLYLFESKGLIKLTKLKKDLKVTITEKGEKFIQAIYVILDF